VIVTKRMLAAMAALLAMSACSEKVVYIAPDGGAGAPAEDAATTEDGATLEDAPSSDAAPYPSGPFGTVSGMVIENLSFGGWLDEGEHDPLSQPYRMWDLGFFYQLGQSGQARHLLLMVSAGWCSVCKSENLVLATEAAVYREGGLEFAEVVFEDDDGAPATKDYLRTYAERFGLPFSVGLDPVFKLGRYFDRSATPANFVIDLETMQIESLMTGYDRDTLLATLDALTAR
jgi:thiol-disulfide isomerase/thioredoxin